jgi:putative ABC transport system permease protein
VAGCTLLVAAMVLTTVIISRGGQESLRLARERLRADVVVVPRGSVTGVEGALLLGNATNTYMPRGVVDKVRAVPGVAQASPQLYLTSMANSSCCSVSLMFMFAFDPTTDFTIEPWLKEKLGHDLQVGEAVGGSDVFVPEGEDKIKLYGYDFDLVGNLEPTGTNLDQTLFMTYQTANAMQEASQTKAKMALPVLNNTVSSVLVKVDPGADRTEVAQAITQAVPEAQAVPAAQMFSSYGDQISGVLRTLVVIVVLTVALSLALMAVIFLMSVHDRRRQIGVLRALGATQRFVLLAYMTEAAVLAVAGGLAGAILAAVIVYFFHDLLVSALGFTIMLPSVLSMVLFVLAGLLVALVVAAAAAFVPALRASREEPAVSMRE